ncbi:MAG: HD-GYP domain-containing protein [Nitrospirae bacterium]|nr:MAG: HD-GYP domain-containing protein [Nitrospirota bacterium]
MKKRISLDQLKPGMFLVEVDRSWWQTPFLRHKRLIKSEQEIQALKHAGVQEVVIDVSRGLSPEGPELENSPDESGILSHPSEDGAQLDFSEERLDTHQGETATEQDKAASTCFIPVEPRVSHPQKLDFCVEVSDGPERSHDPDKPDAKREAIHAAKLLRADTIQAITKIFEGIHTGTPIDNPLLHEATTRIVHHVLADHHTLPQLVLVQNLREVDKDLYSHAVDVCAFALMLAIELGWEKTRLEEVAVGALLHDVGYIRLPRNVVRKRGNCLPAEEGLIRKHPELGIMALQSAQELSEEVKRGVMEHHERLDGSGYPKGMKQDALSSMGILLAIVDHFDAETSGWRTGLPRPAGAVVRDLYHEAQAGKFDMMQVNYLIKCIGIYPVGSLVELSTGERGVVVFVNAAEMLKPAVKVIVDPHGAPYAVPFVVDLACPSPGEPPRMIRALLNPAHEKISVAPYLVSVGW